MRAKYRVDFETNICDLQGKVKIQKKHTYTFLIFFLILFFLVSGCQKLKKELSHSGYFVSVKEKKWMNKFFRDIFLTEQGIYTLWGSKPISRIHVEYYTQPKFSELPYEKGGEVYQIRHYHLKSNCDFFGPQNLW